MGLCLRSKVLLVVCLRALYTGAVTIYIICNDLHLHMPECDLNIYADDTNLCSVGKTVLCFLYAGVVKMVQAKLRSRETKLF